MPVRLTRQQFTDAFGYEPPSAIIPMNDAGEPLPTSGLIEEAIPKAAARISDVLIGETLGAVRKNNIPKEVDKIAPFYALPNQSPEVVLEAKRQHDATVARAQQVDLEREERAARSAEAEKQRQFYAQQEKERVAAAEKRDIRGEARADIRQQQQFEFQQNLEEQRAARDFQVLGDGTIIRYNPSTKGYDIDEELTKKSKQGILTKLKDTEGNEYWLDPDTKEAHKFGNLPYYSLEDRVNASKRMQSGGGSKEVKLGPLQEGLKKAVLDDIINLQMSPEESLAQRDPQNKYGMWDIMQVPYSANTVPGNGPVLPPGAVSVEVDNTGANIYTMADGRKMRGIPIEVPPTPPIANAVVQTSPLLHSAEEPTYIYKDSGVPVGNIEPYVLQQGLKSGTIILKYPDSMEAPNMPSAGADINTLKRLGAMGR